jgi:MFS family permease
MVRMREMSKVPSPATALTVLTGLNLLNYLDRYIPFAVLPAISKSLHLSDAQAGSLQTLFILTYALISPLMGWLGDRRPRFRLAAVGVFVWSAATFASGLAPTFAALVFARALIGVGEASYAVVTPSLLADFYPAARRGRVLAVFYSAIPVGSAAGYILGGSIEAHLGWRAAFFVAGAPGALLALILLTLRDPTRGAQDRDGRSQAGAPQAEVGPRRSARETLRALRARPSYLFNTASQAIYTFAIGGLAAWMPTYFVRERHLTLADADFKFGGLLLLAGFAGTLVGGRAGDALARRRPDGHFLLSGVALIASLPFTLLAVLHPAPAIFWPAMFATLFLLFVNTGPLNAAMANVLPADLRAGGFALYTLAIHVLGDAPSPYLIGVASDRLGGELRTPVLVTGMLLVIAGVVLLIGRPTLRRDLESVVA